MKQGRKVGPVGQKTLGHYPVSGVPPGVLVRVRLIKGKGGRPDRLEFRTPHSRAPRFVDVSCLVAHVYALLPLVVRRGWVEPGSSLVGHPELFVVPSGAEVAS